MKKLFTIALAVAAMLNLASCVSEDVDLGQNGAEAGKGYISLNVTNDDALTTRTVQNAPSTWTVALTGQATVNSTVGTIGSTSLAAGDYSVSVYNYASEAAALAANSNYGDAYYTGSTASDVTVSSGTTTPVNLALGTAKNAKFVIQSTVPASAAITVTATGSGSRVLTFVKAADGDFDHTEAYFAATDNVNIGVTYNGVNLGANKTLTMGGAATENKLVITTNGNGKISLTITYDDEFTTGNTEIITFDAATGEEIPQP